MRANGIVIYWYSSNEYIQVTPANLTKKAKITTTLENWTEEKCWVKLNTMSQVRKLEGDLFELILTYDSERNKDVSGNDLCWVAATIQIKKNAKSGEATWYDFYESNHNGTVEWKLINNGLFKDIKRHRVTRQQRQQEMFREMLVTYDRCCTISDEKTVKALEAAHIIPSSCG